MKKVLLNLVFLFALVCFAEAQEFSLPRIFSDNMVLQQKINNPFWGCNSCFLLIIYYRLLTDAAYVHH